MKGPLVFLGSLLAVALLGFIFVLPALRQRTELEEQLSAPVERASEENPEFRRAIAELERALGQDGPRVLLAEIEKEFGPVEYLDDGSAVLSIPWERLPDLLLRVSRPRAPVLSELRAETSESGDSARVTLSFRTPAERW